MKPFIVFGTGDFSDIVTYLIENDLERKIAAYVLDDQFIIDTHTTYHNKPVIPLSKVESLYSPELYSVAIGFIGKNMFEQREEKFDFFYSRNYELENLIHPSAIMSNCKMGVGNIILENCVFGFSTKIENCNIAWPLVSINHHGTVGSFNNLSPSMSTSGGVKIGNNCFLGNNSTYKNKICVADYTLVGAGAYITHDTERFGVYVPQRTVQLKKSSLDFY